MDFEDILYEKKEGVAKITFNRPEVLNAFRAKTWDELYDALIDAGNDPTVGVVVLTGAGNRAFTAGADQKEGLSSFLGPKRGSPDTLIPEALRRCTKPVIAAVNGYAIGGGNWMVALCDLAIASENARFAQFGPKIGSAARGLIVSHLARVIGEKKAREMWYLCQIYTAEEALEMGLVNKVVPQEKLQEEVDQWCKEILEKSPTCLRTVKTAFEGAEEYVLHLLPISPTEDEFFYTEESEEARKAFLEKRKPDFSRFRR